MESGDERRPAHCWSAALLVSGDERHYLLLVTINFLAMVVVKDCDVVWYRRPGWNAYSNKTRSSSIEHYPTLQVVLSSCRSAKGFGGG